MNPRSSTRAIFLLADVVEHDKEGEEEEEDKQQQQQQQDEELPTKKSGCRYWYLYMYIKHQTQPDRMIDHSML